LSRKLELQLQRGMWCVFYATDIEGVALRRQGRDVYIVAEGVPDLLTDQERAGEKLREIGETWVAYLRLATPRRRVRSAHDIQIGGSARRKHLLPPHHRALWSSEGAGTGMKALLDARCKYGQHAQLRLDAAMSWAGLALDLWHESPQRAAPIMWLALETLYDGPHNVKEVGTRLYRNRLFMELGFELARHIARLQSIFLKDKTSPPSWLSSLPSIRERGSVREWISRVCRLVDEEQEVGLSSLTKEVFSLSSGPVPRSILVSVQRDLTFLYAVRNGFVHTGDFVMEEALAHYLTNVGLEVLKAGISTTIAFARREGARPQSRDQLTLEDAWSAPSPGGAAASSNEC
jgi:hypothetical protein